jgi:hypothetical protein
VNLKPLWLVVLALPAWGDANVGIGWSKPTDPAQITTVRRFRGDCPPPDGAAPDLVIPKAASGAQSVQVAQPVSPRCYCYELDTWSPTGKGRIGEHEVCSSAAPSCH